MHPNSRVKITESKICNAMLIAPFKVRVSCGCAGCARCDHPEYGRRLSTPGQQGGCDLPRDLADAHGRVPSFVGGQNASGYVPVSKPRRWPTNEHLHALLRARMPQRAVTADIGTLH